MRQPIVKPGMTAPEKRLLLAAGRAMLNMLAEEVCRSPNQEALEDLDALLSALGPFEVTFGRPGDPKVAQARIAVQSNLDVFRRNKQQAQEREAANRRAAPSQAQTDGGDDAA